MSLDTFANNFLDAIKRKIISLAKTELANSDKKERLDDYALEQAQLLLNLLPINFVCKWAIKKALFPVIPTITQKIYDILKIKIEGL